MAGQKDLISNKHKWNNCFPKQIQPNGNSCKFCFAKMKTIGRQCMISNGL